MLTEIYMPKNGMDMTEGTIIAWLKQEGDQVEMGEPIMEIETDKITMESEAPASGILLKQLYPAGTTVPVLTTIGYIGEAGEVCPEVGGEASHTEAASNGGADFNEQTSGTASFRKDSAGSDEVAATPYARTLAKERGQQILLELHHLLNNDLRFRTIYALSFFIFICNYHQLKYFKTKGKNISSLLTK